MAKAQLKMKGRMPKAESLSSVEKTSVQQKLMMETKPVFARGEAVASMTTAHSCARYVMPLVAMACAFLLAAGIRLLEVPFWDNSLFFSGAERLLATHDAYHWTAGADGFEFGAGHPLAEVLRFFVWLTGVNSGTVAFWLPVFLTGILAVAVCLWCWVFDAPYAGLCAGVMVSLAPALLARTMLGFCDTDFALIIFPVLLGAMLTFWLRPWLQSPLAWFLNRGKLQRQHDKSSQSNTFGKKEKKAVPKVDSVLLQASAVEINENYCQALQKSLSGKRSFVVLGILLVTSGIAGFLSRDALLPFSLFFLILAIPLFSFISLSGSFIVPTTQLLLCCLAPLYIGWWGVLLGVLLMGTTWLWTLENSFAPVFFGKEESADEATDPVRLTQQVLSWPICFLLVGAGFFANSIQGWHSFFPYLNRYSVALLFVLIIFLGRPHNMRSILLRGWVIYALAALKNGDGFLYASLYAFFARKSIIDDTFEFLARRPNIAQLLRSKRLLHPQVFIWSRWGFGLMLTIILFLVIDWEIMGKLVRSFLFYTTRTEVSRDAQLFYPSATISIIETQVTPWKQSLLTVYDWPGLAALPVVVFAVLLFVFPMIFWLLPFAILFFASQKMGARMTLFGVPAFLMPFYLFLGLICEQVFYFIRSCITGKAAIFVRVTGLGLLFRPPGTWGDHCLKLFFSLTLTCCLVWPMLNFIPAGSTGPLLSRHYADALRYVRAISPEETFVWTWWDWGYATHHFARRQTIADGARHDGATLFLPALVYTADNPRFARQLIKHTALIGNKPHSVLSGKTAEEAMLFLNKLADPATALIQTEGKQYLVVNFELLRIFSWISYYGNWDLWNRNSFRNFSVSYTEPLQYDLLTGQVNKEFGDVSMQADSIDVLSENGVAHFDFGQQGLHFVFTEVEEKQLGEPTAPALTDFWQNFLGMPTFVSYFGDCIALDDTSYNMLLVRLLLGNPEDPVMKPYFSPVYVSPFVRIYEVL